TSTRGIATSTPTSTPQAIRDRRGLAGRACPLARHSAASRRSARRRCTTRRARDAHRPVACERMAAGTITLGDDLEVHRLGFGAMRITGPGIWGEPPDPAGARQLLEHVVEAGVDL